MLSLPTISRLHVGRSQRNDQSSRALRRRLRLLLQVDWALEKARLARQAGLRQRARRGAGFPQGAADCRGAVVGANARLARRWTDFVRRLSSDSLAGVAAAGDVAGSAVSLLAWH